MVNVPVTSLDDIGLRKLMTGWVRSHTQDLQRYVRSRVKDAATADDLVQLTFVSAWQTMEKFAEQSSPRTWLFSILKHKLADHYRKVYREGKQVSGLELTSDEAGENTFTPDGHWDRSSAPVSDPGAFRDSDNERLDRALHHCLDLLPDKLRSAVEMKYLKEKDSEAIQVELGISATNYWQQLHRAKLKLRECIQGRVSRNS